MYSPRISAYVLHVGESSVLDCDTCATEFETWVCICRSVLLFFSDIMGNGLPVTCEYANYETWATSTYP